MSTVLIVAAHPDDEVLGCGGTLARHASMGDRVHILILAEGATSRHADDSNASARDEVRRLREMAQAASVALGTEPPTFAGFPDNRMDGIELIEIVRRIEEVVGRLGPEIVYTHHGADVNVDHQLAHRATLTACRPLPGTTIRSIYAFETVSSTEWASSAFGPAFRPTRYVDITAQFSRKHAALEAYAGEMRDYPHARSYRNVEALARHRGATVSVAMAEAFEVVREVVS